MDFVVAMGKAAVGRQSGLHTFPLFLADKGRDLRHQDPLFAGHVDTAETGVLARRGTRAAFHRATTTPAVAIHPAHVCRIRQQSSDAGQVPALQPLGRAQSTLMEQAGQRTEAVRLLRIPGEHLAHNGGF